MVTLMSATPSWKIFTFSLKMLMLSAATNTSHKSFKLSTMQVSATGEQKRFSLKTYTNSLNSTPLRLFNKTSSKCSSSSVMKELRLSLKLQLLLSPQLSTNLRQSLPSSFSWSPRSKKSIARVLSKSANYFWLCRNQWWIAQIWKLSSLSILRRTLCR